MDELAQQYRENHDPENPYEVTAWPASFEEKKRPKSRWKRCDNVLLRDHALMS
jgi:hypothetical protein